ncbi:hypothetical protein ALCH109712_03275 [Alkalicoccus chagannorensis]
MHGETPKVIKTKNGTPTVIEWLGQRYTLTHPSHTRGNQEIQRRAQ